MKNQKKEFVKSKARGQNVRYVDLVKYADEIREYLVLMVEVNKLTYANTQKDFTLFWDWWCRMVNQYSDGKCLRPTIRDGMRRVMNEGYFYNNSPQIKITTDGIYDAFETAHKKWCWHCEYNKKRRQRKKETSGQ